jgi:NAD(P)H-hydrate epimerase
LSASPITLDAAYCARLLPHRPADSHKGTFGTVVCICGSLDYAGAALLSGTAAMRAGAGMAALAVPATLQALFAGRVPELITVTLPESDNGTDINAMEAGHALKARSADALVFGSGIAESTGYSELLAGLLAREGAPIVVDGGGLNLLAKSAEWWREVQRPVVLTPHPGEVARLTSDTPSSDDERLRAARAAAERFGQVIVLKGARTVVCAPADRSAISSVANAALATAGSGDVLAGTIGSLLAQGLERFDAACLGVYLHARSGERLSWRFGNAGVLAGDMAAELPMTRHELDAHSG